MHRNKQQMTGSSGGVGLRHRGQVLLILLSLFGYWQPCKAADFPCTTSGDVQCLIEAITAANANGQVNTITLAAGTYTLTEIYNETPSDPNGLPVITSTLTIMG